MKHTPRTRRTGEIGENIAVRLLQAKGYTILVRNFRSRRNEIDIIALDGAILVFVEVKTRRRLRQGEPPPLRAAQKRRITRAARNYLRFFDMPTVACRFDFIEITLYRSWSIIRKLSHIRDFWRMARLR